MINTKIINYENITSGKSSEKYDGYKELAQCFINNTLYDYDNCCYRVQFWREEFKDFTINERKEKYLIELFVDKDPRFDALTYGLISRDMFKKKLKIIRNKYHLGKEDGQCLKQNQDTL